MARRWTSEQRAAQAEAIKRWKPWEKSTGPATETGKATASQNAVKHGMRGKEWLDYRKSTNALLRKMRDLLDQL